MSHAAFDTSHSGYVEGDVVLGKYVLTALLATGGVGAVWRGRNELLATDVAIKLIVNQEGAASSGLTEESATLVRRAHAEARLAAQLRHPAVCQALDFGVTHRGDPVIVSELLRGDPVDKLMLFEGKVESTRAIQLLLPIVDALGAAHAQGVVHRDVKPSNIFLARDGNGGVQPKLLDFGIARVVHDSTRVTAAGSVCGTPDYMSPEQARGCTDVDARSDLWSICVTLYELVSGRGPFVGENWNAVMYSVINDAPLPLGSHAAGDADLVRLLERGLQKRREDRFQTATELAAALSGLLLARGVELDLSGRSLRMGRSEWVCVTLANTTPCIDSWHSPDAPRITEPLESAPATSRGPDGAAASGPPRRLRAGAWIAVLLIAVVGSAAGLLYRSSAGPSPSISRNPAPPSAPPTAGRIVVEPVATPLPVRAHTQRPPSAAGSSKTAAPAMVPPQSEPVRAPAGTLPEDAAAAKPEKNGTLDAAGAPDTRPPTPFEASSLPRSNGANALGYDFGL